MDDITAPRPELRTVKPQSLLNEATQLSKKKPVCAESLESFQDQLSHPEICKSSRTTPNSVGSITVAREQGQFFQYAEAFYEMGPMIGRHIPANAG